MEKLLELYALTNRIGYGKLYALCGVAGARHLRHIAAALEAERRRAVRAGGDALAADRDGNKQYPDIFHAVTKSARNALNQAVLNAYDVKLQQIQATEIEVEKTPDEEMADEPEPEMSM